MEPVQGPRTLNLQGTHDGDGRVSLQWTWTGDTVSFNVLRNGVLVGTTNETTFVDRPLMSGLNEYTVQPFEAERTFLRGTGEVRVEVTGVEIEQPEPSRGLGYGLGAGLVLVLLLLQFMVLRKGGGRA